MSTNRSFKYATSFPQGGRHGGPLALGRSDVFLPTKRITRPKPCSLAGLEERRETRPKEALRDLLGGIGWEMHFERLHGDLAPDVVEPRQALGQLGKAVFEANVRVVGVLNLSVV